MSKLPDQVRISAPVSPFTDKGDFMPDAYAELIRWYVERGTRGFLVAADNGEHWTLSVEEIARITEITMKESEGKLPVYVGAWAITERETIERAEAAANAGAYGLCVKPQFYVHSWADATEADIIGRFEAVAKAVPLPMMVYNSPNRTGVNISHELLHKICDVVEADCLKDTSGDANFLLQRVLQFKDKLSVLVGGSFFYTGMLLARAAPSAPCWTCSATRPTACLNSRPCPWRSGASTWSRPWKSASAPTISAPSRRPTRRPGT